MIESNRRLLRQKWRPTREKSRAKVLRKMQQNPTKKSFKASKNFAENRDNWSVNYLNWKWIWTSTSKFINGTSCQCHGGFKSPDEDYLLPLCFPRLVIETLQDVDKDRKCFRMVGGVLVERTVKEVLPALTTNRDQVIYNFVRCCKVN